MFDYTLYYYSNRVQIGTGYFINKTLHNTAVKLTILVKKKQLKQTTKIRGSYFSGLSFRMKKKRKEKLLEKKIIWQKQRK